MKVLTNILFSSTAVLITAYLLAGVAVDNFATALAVALFMGVVNAAISKVLLLLTLPVNILSLGLTTFLITGVLILLAAKVLPGFHVAGFRWALAFALLLSIVNALFRWSMTAKPSPSHHDK